MEPKLIKEYVEEGTLRIEWRDFPYQGRESVSAALAARAAQAQGKFWEYHDLLYANQSSGNTGGYSEENLVALAKKAGLDRRRFEEDLKSARYNGVVQADFREGQRLGISGTPTFIINDQVLVGLQPLQVFEQAIEEARREAEGG
ncbi:MAG: thioredoxin domain-containing protein [Actinomycetota bacterium]|nr:thioredoxin domain-containing protein [Actinomycetota bacterium]